MLDVQHLQSQRRGRGVEFPCVHETVARCCVVTLPSQSELRSCAVGRICSHHMTSHAGLESYQSQNTSQCAARVTPIALLHGSGAELKRTPWCCDSELETRVKPRTLESGGWPEQ